MSIFASRTVKTLEIPFDPPQTVTIQKLAGRHLEKAHQASLVASLDNLKLMGGPAFQRELAAIGDPQDRAEQVAALQADPLNAYDRYVLLAHGITGWSYD